ncbi:MAG: Crp/Fnr family transcriptional regulator [Muribaculaceae bacterium]|nr:Crp/Fnr family transcriptional regulator [Muribaculaceae bacterium]
MGIVKEGYFKFIVQNTKDHEVVTGFSFAGDVITDYVRGFLFELPCPTSIVAGSDAVVLQVPINNVRRYILERKPDFIAETSSKLLQEAYNHYLDLLVKTPGERYAELKSRYPGMIESIPKQEIASYLGVSRRQLHRIRETDCDNESSKN